MFSPLLARNLQWFPLYHAGPVLPPGALLLHRFGQTTRLIHMPDSSEKTIFRVVSKILYLVVLLLSLGSATPPQEHRQEQWSPAQRIPGLDADTLPPVMVADREQTVHAFVSQMVGADPDATKLAIVYSQWSLVEGWSEPRDILLSPLKREARILDAYLDHDGFIHLIFFGGDGTEALIYYTRAVAENADHASAWAPVIEIGAEPIAPESGAIVSDSSGYLTVLYSGRQDGEGIYATYSEDNGNSWYEPVPIFFTADDALIPFGLQISVGESSGLIHATWNTDNIAGQGRGIYYAQARLGVGRWSDPVEIAKVDTGLGAKHPAVIEHHGDVIVVYNIAPKLVMRVSSDLGTSWADPVVIFARHVGVNGTVSLVEDSNSILHLFFGQRISGSPDIHGMWHSIWGTSDWAEPTPIVSGPRVVDIVGDSGFDPFDARAVVSQGNVILVTWRTDPGDIKPNGVWYSYSVLDAPELPIIPQTASSTNQLSSSQATSAPVSTPATPRPTTTVGQSESSGPVEPSQAANPTTVPIVSVVPVALVIVILLLRSFYIHSSGKRR